MLNKIFNEDAFDLIKKIPDNYIDLIILDPPYNLFKAIEWDKKPFNINLLWLELKRIKKPNTPILIFCSGKLKYDLYNSNLKMFKYDLIWQRNMTGNPFNAKYMPLRKHEYIMVFGNGKITYNPQLVEGTPYKRNYTPHKKNNMKYGIKGVEIDNKGTRHPSMIIEHRNNWSKSQQLYPTQKPVSLYQWLIKSYSNKNDIVLDLMGGSGGLMIGSLKENRNYIINDLNTNSFNIMKERLSYFNKNKKDYYDK